MIKRILFLITFVVTMFASMRAQMWTAPQVPAEDLVNLKSTTV